MIPAMKKEGYEADFASAVTASSSTVGPIIPPSLPMIIAGSLTGLSIGKLFLAGAIPGVLLAFGLMGISYYISVKKGHPKNARVGIRKIGRGFIDAFWAILMTFLILFGIVGGVFTPTELKRRFSNSWLEIQSIHERSLREGSKGHKAGSYRILTFSLVP